MAQHKKKKEKFNIKNFFRLAESGTSIDMTILIITLTLVVFGLVMLYSASYVVGIYRMGDSLHYIKNQLLFALVGLGAMFFMAKVDYRVLQHYSLTLMLCVYFLLVIVLFMKPIKGVTRWIIIPGVLSFQPSEIAKFAVILMFASLIQKNADKMKTLTYGVVPFGLVLASVSGLMLLEPHLSGTVIICAIGAIMMFVGGTDVKWFALGGTLLVVAIVGAVILFPDLVPYASERIIAWRHPELDLQGKGYQSYQSLLAIGSGGLFGLGLGNSRQKHLHLPEPQNDFIFSVICEELGFIGGMIVISLFFALLVRGIYIATKAKDKFGAMLVVGIIGQITLQAFLNIAVATNTIPNTGISLPFFSEGGTSLMMLLAEIGIVLSVSRYSNTGKGDE
ncbi:MAG: putative peptidoglycan glycosyltransferase FtsW [Oscillospiraceae bacterium]